MEAIQKMFNYNENPVRTIVQGETIYFVAKDVCNLLEIAKNRDAVSRLDDDERGSVLVDTLGGKQTVTAVNESGLYSIIFTSRKEEAKKFKKWVTSEVLPTVRKHGVYMTDDVLEKTITDPDFMIDLLTSLKAEKQKRLKAESTVSILTHVNKTYTATEIAKELGFKSARALNQDIARRKLQFQQNGTWVFYSKYADKGYVEIKQDVLDNGRVIYHRRFTQLGREFLIRMYGLEQEKA
ncbi:BRO family protein [Rossellomorea vietnamensis]|uniref:BRO family protein n=1 Tax=Rossellomorea vietnamensis TaxID=218284 RepID=UPI001E29820E|nr:BRO family protein [Rossellomorea vietnamensis]